MNDVILNLLMFVGGISFFIYGMNIMSGSLTKVSGGKFEVVLRKLTSNPIKGILFGIGVTGLIQSSSAVTVMLVGLVNSGIMELSQSVGIIMGSNIGTTVTAWLLSLVGIESDNLILKLFKPDNFSPIIALAGLLLTMASKSQKRKDIGHIMVGFALLMFGMSVMSDAVKPLSELEGFKNALVKFNNPFIGVAVGAILTAIIQSSSASLGILQAVSMTGTLTFGMAFPIIMGQNIGTCVTSLISSIGVNKNAKRVAVIHMSFNLIGTTIFLMAYFIFTKLFTLTFADSTMNPLGIAVAHTVFNIATTVILVPFYKKLVKLSELIIPYKEAKDEKTIFIDERLLKTPSVAISECSKNAEKMADVAFKTISCALDNIKTYDKKNSEIIKGGEDALDIYEDKLGTVLVKVSKKSLSDENSLELSKLLHTIGDFERIGDHAINLLKVAEEIDAKKISFSPEAQEEIKVLSAALKETMDITVTAYKTQDIELAKKVEPLEQVIDALISDIKIRHIDRLKMGFCTIELGFILSDLLTSCERVSDHCSNIAVALIEVNQSRFDTHKYLNALKRGNDTEFKKLYDQYYNKYKLV